MRLPTLRGLAVRWLAPIGVGVLAVIVAGRVLGGPDRALALNTGPAPWPLPDRAGEHISAAHLPTYRQSEPLAHPHAHLDIFVDGRPFPVAAGLGLVEPYSPLHTHSDSGILHMESPDDAGGFTLGHLFTVWGVRLDSTCVGAYCAPSKPAALYINGTPTTGPLRQARLVPYSEMVLAIGTPPPFIPSHYDCHNAADLERTSCQGFLTPAGPIPGDAPRPPNP